MHTRKLKIVLIAITTFTVSTLSVLQVVEAKEVRNIRDVPLEQYSASTEYRARQTSRSVAVGERTMHTDRGRVREHEVSPIPATSIPSAEVQLEVVPKETPTPVEVEPVVVLKETSDTSPDSIPTKPTVTEITPEPVVVPVASAPSVDIVSEPVADAYLAALASEIHRLTNIERKEAGVSKLTYDRALVKIATGHSEDMAEDDYFSHTTPDGCTLTCRFEAANYQATSWGENVAWRSSSIVPSTDDLAAYFIDMWMNSEGHRQNLLSDKYTHEGVGLAKIGNKVYATVNFAKPI